MQRPSASFFLYKHPSTPQIYTLSLHDALPISAQDELFAAIEGTALHTRVILDRMEQNGVAVRRVINAGRRHQDRESTRLNSSHEWISYAVFCLKKKKQRKNIHIGV